MSDSPYRVSGSASPARKRTTALLVRIDSAERVCVEDYWGVPLGIGPEEARTISCDIAGVLGELADEIAGQCRDLGGSSEEAGPRRGDGLKLPEGRCQYFLDRLRHSGAGLRVSLSGALRNAIEVGGFPAATRGEDPALNFVHPRNPVPILWDLLYQGEQDDPLDPDGFWGLRAPITHWIAHDEIPYLHKKILVSNGLFTAVSEGLLGAGREETALGARLMQWARRMGWAKELRHDNLVGAVGKKVGVTGATPDWCSTLLAEKRSDPITLNEWKRRMLRTVIEAARGYEVIHFACHCQATRLTELHSALEVTVGGESFKLDVSFLRSMRLGDLKATRRGPLVFLNACGSGSPNPSGEPPGFPVAWLQYGAVAVIATLCRVPDWFAYVFAVTFYQFLSLGLRKRHKCHYRFLAEALLATRRYFLRKYNNPLGLAYVLYARGDTCVEAEGLTRGTFS